MIVGIIQTANKNLPDIYTNLRRIKQKIIIRIYLFYQIIIIFNLMMEITIKK